MRLIRITTNYSNYLRQFYSQHLELLNESYNVQYRSLMEDCYGWADFWTNSLSKFGYQVWEPVGNAEPMQKAWAKENNVTYSEKEWLTDIIVAQVKRFQPDIVFATDFSTYTSAFLEHLRCECGSIKLVVGWCGSPFSNTSTFKNYDLVLSNIPSVVKSLNEHGHQSKYMYHAFEPKILDRINSKLEKKVNFSFIGSIIKHDKFHNEREELLKQLIKKTDLQLWLSIDQSYYSKLISIKSNLYRLIQRTKTIPQVDTFLSNPFLSKIPKIKNYIEPNEYFESLELRLVDPFLRRYSHPPLFGLDMYQKLYESQITFNTHIDISKNFASNMRLYEATGVGTCLLTDWKSNLAQIFEPDFEVVTYKNIEEAVEKVNYLLDHKDECSKIAIAGQKKTLKHHTFAHRAEYLNDTIKQLI